MKTIFILLLGLAVSLQLSAQVDHSASPRKINQKVENWVFGTVVFSDGSTWECEFSYNPLVPEGLLKVKDGDKILTCSPFKVSSFSFTDNFIGKEHTYYSIQVNSSNKVFIELLYEGSKFSLLGRESIRIKVSSPSSHLYGDPTYSSSKVKPTYDRYIYNQAAKKYAFVTKKNILYIFKDKKKELKKYISQNKIKLLTDKDFIEIIKEYERLM